MADGDPIIPGGIFQQIMSVLKNIVVAINGLREASTINGTSSTATGGSATLPANPVTFVTVTVNGVSYKLPAYN